MSPRRWTPIEERLLTSLVGSKSVRVIAQRLNRSVAAIRKRLRRLGETRTRVREGLTKGELAQLVGSSPKTIQRWIDFGWLNGTLEGKNRDDDTIRISDKQFLEFWRSHPEQVLVHRWNREGLEWLVLLLGEVAERKAIEPHRQGESDGTSMATAG